MSHYRSGCIQMVNNLEKHGKNNVLSEIISLEQATSLFFGAVLMIVGYTYYRWCMDSREEFLSYIVRLLIGTGFVTFAFTIDTWFVLAGIFQWVIAAIIFLINEE